MSIKVKITNKSGINAKNIMSGQLFKDSKGETFLRLNGGAISLGKDPNVFNVAHFHNLCSFHNCSYVSGNVKLEVELT